MRSRSCRALRVRIDGLRSLAECCKPSTNARAGHRTPCGTVPRTAKAQDLGDRGPRRLSRWTGRRQNESPREPVQRWRDPAERRAQCSRSARAGTGLS